MTVPEYQKQAAKRYREKQKKEGKKPRSIVMTDEEFKLVRQFLNNYRKET